MWSRPQGPCANPSQAAIRCPPDTGKSGSTVVDRIISCRPQNTGCVRRNTVPLPNAHLNQMHQLDPDPDPRHRTVN